MRNKWGIIVLCLWLTSTGLAQVNFEPVHFNITTEQGLPSMETYSAMQDSKGFIWICTDAGVCRYDGYEFKTFTTKDGLTDNIVFNTYEDYKGNIWFVTYNSKLCYWDGERIRSYKYNNLIEYQLGGISPMAKRIWIDKEGTLFFDMLSAGLISITKDGQLKTHQFDNHIFAFGKVGGVLAMCHDMRWKPVVEDGCIDIYYFDGKNSQPVVKNYYMQYRSNILRDDQGYSNRYFFVDGKIHDTENLSKGALYSDGEVLDALYHKGKFYISTLKGLQVGQLKNGRIEIESHFFENNIVSCILFDKEGNAWVSTLDRGVFFVKDFSIRAAGEKQGFNVADVRSIVEWKKDILACGLTSIQSLKGSVKLPEIQDEQLARLEVSNDKLFISMNLKATDVVPTSVPDIYMMWWGVLMEHNDTLCGISRSGYFTVAPDLKWKFVHPHKKNKNELYRATTLSALTTDNKGHMYVGDKSGVYEVAGDKLLPINMAGQETFDVAELDWNESWGLVVSTVNNGIYTFKDGKLRHYGEEEGLLSNRINTLLISKDGSLLIGTPVGLSVVKKDGRVGVLGMNHLSRYSDITVIFENGDGIYLGTKEGIVLITHIDEGKFQKKKAAEVQLKELWQDGKSLGKMKHVELPYETMSFTIDFSVLQFDNWNSKNYQYRIGKEGEWVDISKPTINLYRPSGEFDVYVRYMNNRFQWSDPVNLCHFSVQTPYWKLFYFWAIIGLAAFILTLYTLQRRQSRINQRLIRENQILQLEQQMLLHEQQMEHARMNPHFIFNVLNSIHSFILHEETGEAEKYLMMFSRLMREILIKAREGTVSIADECSVLGKYLELEQLRFKGQFSYCIEVDPDDLGLSIPSMFVQPFIENAVIHGVSKTNGQSREISLNFVQDGHQCMKVTICNSGVISKEDRDRLYSSGDKNAFGITKKRLANYNSLLKTNVYGLELLVTTEPQPTTCIILRIPIL